MKTQIFKNEKTGAAIYEMDGVILYETVNATSNCFDLNNYDDFREFIKDVIIGGGYTDGLVKTISEDGIGKCSIDDAVIFFNETIKPLI